MPKGIGYGPKVKKKMPKRPTVKPKLTVGNKVAKKTMSAIQRRKAMMNRQMAATKAPRRKR